MNKELNLLPPDRRLFLTRQLVINSVNRFLKTVVWSLLAMTLVGVFSIVVLRLWLVFSSDRVTVSLATEVAKYQGLREDIATRNNVLLQMKTVSDERVVWSDLFPDLFVALPPATTISRFSGDVLTSNPKLTLSGQSVSRSALVVLEDRLRKLEWAQDVSAPNSNLLERVNPTYVFNISLKPFAESAKKSSN